MNEKKTRKYYSTRTGNLDPALKLSSFGAIFKSIYEDFLTRGYFNEYFGFSCVDQGFIPGKVGTNLEGYILRTLRRKSLWPIPENYFLYSEGDLFDMIEFLFDHISKPLEDGATYHSWNNCGWHYVKFDKLAGQFEYANEINQFLNDYKTGYEIDSTSGEILALAENPDMQKLLSAPIPLHESGEIDDKIKNAVNKFRKYGSTLEERSEAVRNLVDCLEYLKPQINGILSSKDESDLFNIANNFSIRHHNEKQKNNFDKNIWLSWMFYFYLATLHTCLRLIHKKDQKS